MLLRRIDLAFEPGTPGTDGGTTPGPVTLFRSHPDTPWTRPWGNGDWCAALPRDDAWSAERMIVETLGRIGLMPAEGSGRSRPFQSAGRLARRIALDADHGDTVAAAAGLANTHPAALAPRDPAEADTIVRYFVSPWGAALEAPISGHRMLALLATPGIAGLETDQGRPRPGTGWYEPIVP